MTTSSLCDINGQSLQCWTKARLFHPSPAYLPQPEAQQNVSRFASLESPLGYKTRSRFLFHYVQGSGKKNRAPRPNLQKPLDFIRCLSMESFEELDDNFGTHSQADYFEDIQLALLYVKIPSKLHAGISRQFMRIFDDKIEAMGMPKYDISWLGNSRFRGFRRSKQPDECFFPTENVDHEEWPALVIETGVSETLPQLHRDAIWWFRQSPNINYVLLVNVDRSQRTIHIEKWERCRPREPCITRSHTEAIPDPCPSETATISETGVTRTFTLSFRSLFKRPASERRGL